MLFDPENKLVKMCAEGMDMEGKGLMDEASQMFLQAWTDATTEIEQFIAAHYVARHQDGFSNKLLWDERALNAALKISDPAIKASLPSLYLNLAKGHEDLGDAAQALLNYQLAASFIEFLPGDGYGKMIRSGIEAGVRRLG